MTSSRNAIASVAAVFAALLLATGCSSSGGPQPDAPDSGALEVEAAWLDGGRAVAVVTRGSSTCVPTVADVTAKGQRVMVELEQAATDAVCTADYTARASLVTLPKGVTPAEDLTLEVTLGGASGRAELTGSAALDGVPGEPTEYQPSAGWFDDTGLVLLTWGSSSCPPVIDSAEANGGAGTVVFVTEDRLCTMDMGPRTTLVEFGDLERSATDNFVLTLVGDGFDAQIPVQQR